MSPDYFQIPRELRQTRSGMGGGAITSADYSICTRSGVGGAGRGVAAECGLLTTLSWGGARGWGWEAITLQNFQRCRGWGGVGVAGVEQWVWSGHNVLLL